MEFTCSVMKYLFSHECLKLTRHGILINHEFRYLRVRRLQIMMKKTAPQRQVWQKVNTTIEALQQDQGFIFLPSQLEASNFGPQAQISMMNHLQRVGTRLRRKLERAFLFLTRRRHVILLLRTFWRSSFPRQISRCHLCLLLHLTGWTE